MADDILHFLATRRSTKPALLAEPGPDSATLDRILTIAARVPDHKKLVPWRFIVFEGPARARFGDLLARACAAEDKEPPSSARLETERRRFVRAPIVVAVVSRVVANPAAPEWEQTLSAGASAYNMCLAAKALGFDACWITEWYSYSATVASGLGLGANERIAGFVYIGTAAEVLPDRERPDLAAIVTRWHG